MWALSDRGGGKFQSRGSFCENSQALLPRHWNLRSVVQVMPLCRLEEGRQGSSPVGGRPQKRIGSIDQSQHLDWEADAAPPALPSRSWNRGAALCPGSIATLWKKETSAHIFLWTNQTCAWLHRDFPSLPLTATVLCPLPPPKGMLSPAQLLAVCFINEHHGLPGLSASTPCCLPPVSQSPGMALVRQAGPAGPEEAGVGAAFRGTVLSHHLAPHMGQGRDTSRGVWGTWQRTWEAAGTTPGLLFWGFWAELFISQVRATCCSGDCPSSGSKHSSSRLDTLLVSDCEWRWRTPIWKHLFESAP